MNISASFKVLLVTALFGCSFWPIAPVAAAQSYAVAAIPTPVFNTPDFAGLFGGTRGTRLVTDSCGQMRQLEFVALPGTVFQITGTLSGGPALVYRVTSTEYPYPSKTGFYIDARFVTITSQPPAERPRLLPPRQVVIDRLVAARGSIYVWGGNIRSGIPQMSRFFPPGKGTTLTETTRKRWELRGVDCSGLLYEATDGYTPRNTSALVRFGKGIPVAGLSTDEIIRRVEPLDLIVWNGHVLIILDRERLIESHLDCKTGEGVRIRPLREALAEIRKIRVPLDSWEEKGTKGFVIRRWYE